MNTLLVVSDSHNAGCLGALNGLTRTPALDGVARRGALFTAAYCAYPLCVPSRGSMFAGRYAHEIGAWDNAFPWGGTPAGWPAALNAAGVLFAATGKMHLKGGADLGIEQAFNVGQINTERHVDVFGLLRDQPVRPRASMYIPTWWAPVPRADDASLSVSDANAVATTERAVDWLMRRRPADRPWTLYVGYQKPHPPWTPRRALYDHYMRAMPDLTPKYLQPEDDLHPVDRQQARHTCGYARGADDLRRMHARYHATVEELDGKIGRLITALTDLDLLDDTLIVYTSDHGEMLRAHGKLGKLSLYEDSIRVPLILAGPGVTHGLRVDAPVSLPDVFPTIADACGLPPAPDKRGRSLLPLASGAPDAARADFIVSEIHGNAWPCAGFAVRCGQWKLMEYLGHAPALYDLAADPDEMRDLVRAHGENDARVRPRLAALRARLRQWGNPEEIDRRARADQKDLREKLEASGMLRRELRRSG